MPMRLVLRLARQPVAHLRRVDRTTPAGWLLKARAEGSPLSTCELREIDTTGYQRLRIAIGLLGLALPVVLVLLGGPDNLRHSLSAYYYANTPALWGILSPRDVFVGSLFAIGVFLHSYDGCSRGEVLVCNLAGVLAMGIAICPMDPPLPACCPPGAGGACAARMSFHAVLHYASASGFFLLIIVVATLLRDTTLALFDKLGQPARKRHYARIYTLLAVVMGLVPPGVGVAAGLLGGCVWPHGVLVVEVMGVWAFALFWLVKAGEIAEIERLLGREE